MNIWGLVAAIYVTTSRVSFRMVNNLPGFILGAQQWCSKFGTLVLSPLYMPSKNLCPLYIGAHGGLLCRHPPLGCARDSHLGPSDSKKDDRWKVYTLNVSTYLQHASTLTLVSIVISYKYDKDRRHHHNDAPESQRHQV